MNLIAMILINKSVQEMVYRCDQITPTRQANTLVDQKRHVFAENIYICAMIHLGSSHHSHPSSLTTATATAATASRLTSIH
jgi:hypothetical protein